MDIDLKGFKENWGDKPMGDLIIHKNHRMTESETRMAVNWGIANGYKLASELPDKVIDTICDPTEYHAYAEYDDTPEFFSLESLRSILHQVSPCGYIYEQTPDELIEKIKEIL